MPRNESRQQNGRRRQGETRRVRHRGARKRAAEGHIEGFLFPGGKQQDAEARRNWLVTKHPGFEGIANHATGPFYKQQLIKLARIALFFWRFHHRLSFFRLQAHALTGDQYDQHNVEYFFKRLVHGRIAYKKSRPTEEIPRNAAHGDRVLCRLVDRLQALWLVDEDGYQGQEFQGDKQNEEEFENENEAVTAYLYTMASFVQDDSAALLKGLPEPPTKLEDFMKLSEPKRRRNRPQRIPTNLAVRVKTEPPSSPELHIQQNQDIHGAIIGQENENRSSVSDDREALSAAKLLLDQAVTLMKQSANEEDLDLDSRVKRSKIRIDMEKSLLDIELLLRK